MIIKNRGITRNRNNCLVVERGLVNKEFFYIPKDLVENYDGKLFISKIRRRDRKKYVNKGSLFERST